ncbi:MAG: helix-turn-helix transcriptional regulator [Lachnospiraceae bacterium]|nr:helix-turn-helix transcriptional regulator [Lachnospiraceae bacterium]
MEERISYTEIAMKNICIIATARNISIGDMEKKIGICQGYISRLKNKKNTSFDTIVKISKYLNVSLDELIKTDFIDEIEKKFGEK